jgi:hypothetical protein
VQTVIITIVLCVNAFPLQTRPSDVHDLSEGEEIASVWVIMLIEINYLCEFFSIWEYFRCHVYHNDIVSCLN